MLLNISQHSELTLQDQIISQIRARILKGELEPDHALTSIRALSKSLRVGVNTVQRAYDHLLAEELIYVRPGKGFFVAPLEQSDKTDLAKLRFSESLQLIMHEAEQEGLNEKDIKQIFSQLQLERNNDDA